MFKMIVCVAIISQFAFAQSSKFAVMPDWQPYQSSSKEQPKESLPPWSFERTSSYGNLSPARFCSVDPLADQYPNWTPYHYAINNPMRFVDPTGKWIATYDSAGNIVNVQAEKGDNLEGLYKQIGISVEEFAKKYNISDMSKFEVVAGQTTFNITDFVFANGQNTAFSIDPTNMNCFSSCLVGTGVVDQEIEIKGGSQFTQQSQELFGFVNQSTPQTGTMQTWVDQSGVTNHAAIYVVKDQAGNEYYVGRPGLNSPVTMQTSISTSRLYPGFQVFYLRRK